MNVKEKASIIKDTCAYVGALVVATVDEMRGAPEHEVKDALRVLYRLHVLLVGPVRTYNINELIGSIIGRLGTMYDNTEAMIRLYDSTDLQNKKEIERLIDEAYRVFCVPLRRNFNMN